jgi:hypothetical protein
MTTGKHDANDELSGVQWEKSHSGGSNVDHDLHLPRVTPIEGGEVVAVYPDDETAEAMRSEDWKWVQIGWIQNDEGDYEQLVLRKADRGIKIRYYKHQRVNIHVTVKHRGTAKAKSSPGACTVRRAGDAFVFGIIDQISIDSGMPIEDMEAETEPENTEKEQI